MVLDILKAILAGVCVALPVGPVLVLTARRTILDGRKAGLLCGLGTAIVDTIYTTLAIFALAFINDFVSAYEPELYLIGFLILLCLGFMILRRKIEIGSGTRLDKVNFANCAGPTMLSAAFNPGSVAYIITVVAVLGLNYEKISAPVWVIALAVFAGELLYWYLITYLIKRYFSLKDKLFSMINRLVGIAICVFALALLVRGLMILI